MSRESYSCPRCAKTLFPSFSIGPKATLVVECAACQYQDASLGPADFTKGIACVSDESSGSGEPGWGGKRMVVVNDQASHDRVPTATQPPAPITHTTAPAPHAPHAPVAYAVAAPQAPRDVIGMIEERSAWLMGEEARIVGEIAESQARLAGVRAESRQLQRMLQSGKERQRRALPTRLKLAQ